MNAKDNHKPNGKWEFNESVTSVFPDMLSRSIPGYGVMRDSVVRVAKKIFSEDKDSQCLLDLGCSRGDTIYEILDAVETKSKISCVGVDSSPSMIATAKELFQGWDNVNFIQTDLVDIEIFPGKYSVITCVLTAQFIPLDARQMFYEQVHKGLSTDGAFIIVEKVLGETPSSQALLVDIYHDFKREKGYTDEQIEEKRKSLQGVLVPLRGSENELMLKDAGFTNIQRFWQCLNFVGWVATK